MGEGSSEGLRPSPLAAAIERLPRLARRGASRIPAILRYGQAGRRLAFSPPRRLYRRALNARFGQGGRVRRQIGLSRYEVQNRVATLCDGKTLPTFEFLTEARSHNEKWLAMRPVCFPPISDSFSSFRFVGEMRTLQLLRGLRSRLPDQIGSTVSKFLVQQGNLTSLLEGRNLHCAASQPQASRLSLGSIIHLVNSHIYET